MKRILLCILLLVTLSACVDASVSDWSDCNEGKELCIRVTVEEPIVIGKPINLTTVVTSKKDIQDMIVSLSYVPAQDNIVTVNVNGLEKLDMGLRELEISPGSAGGLVSIYAHQPLIINWQISAPKWEGLYILNARVFASSSPVTDTIRLYFTEEGGQVYYAGTPIPTDQPIPIITITPGPSPTWAPSATLYPQIATEVALTQQAATPPPPSP